MSSKTQCASLVMGHDLHLICWKLTYGIQTTFYNNYTVCSTLVQWVWLVFILANMKYIFVIRQGCLTEGFAIHLSFCCACDLSHFPLLACQMSRFLPQLIHISISLMYLLTSSLAIHISQSHLVGCKLPPSEVYKIKEVLYSLKSRSASSLPWQVQWKNWC